VRALLTILSAIALLTLVASAVVHTTSVTHATLVGLSQATLHRGLLCAAPVVAGGLFAYALLALNASTLATRSCKHRRASRASDPDV
jgi:hypothetical protein